VRALAVAPALGLAALMGAAALGTALADDIQFPSRRPGLWEQSVSTGDVTKNTSKSCVSHESDHAMMQYGFQKLKEMGGTMTVTGGPKVFHIETSNTVNGRKVASATTLTFVDDTTVQSRGHMHMDAAADPKSPMGAAMDMDMTNDSVWKGPCPADMQPGDMIMNGRKMNVLKDMQSGDAAAKPKP
jgi:hypothetical protein